MTRSQLRSTIRWESVIIALQGTVLGLLIGIFFGWALVTALADEGIDHSHPVPQPRGRRPPGRTGRRRRRRPAGAAGRKLNVLQAIATE